ncbi:hypothetical protein CAPTEDRAFT_86699, partial [Capitella teleta]
EDPRVFRTFGVHPSRVGKCSRRVLLHMRDFLQHPRAVAVGEMGLNYHRNISEAQRGAQIAVFHKQLLMAVELQKPMVIHCRDLVGSRAEIDCLAIMKSIVPRFHRIHCHCFGGSLHQMWSWKRCFPNTVFGFAGAL